MRNEGPQCIEPPSPRHFHQAQRPGPARVRTRADPDRAVAPTRYSKSGCRRPEKPAVEAAWSHVAEVAPVNWTTESSSCVPVHTAQAARQCLRETEQSKAARGPFGVLFC